MWAIAARSFPCSADSPWTILIGMDELTPGDKHKPKNLRKMMVFSYNVVELGRHALCTADTWVTPSIVRSHEMCKIKGGWSRMLRVLLRMMTTGPLAVSRVGVPLRLHGEMFVLFAKVKLLISDLDGLRICFDWMGTSSHRPCLKCANVWYVMWLIRACYIYIYISTKTFACDLFLEGRTPKP